MTFEAEFGDLMVDTVTVQKQASLDKYGVQSYGTGSSLTGRLVRQTRMVRDSTGREVVSNAHFFTEGPAGVLPTDRVTFPDGSVNDVLRVDAFPDEDGAHHEVVYF